MFGHFDPYLIATLLGAIAALLGIVREILGLLRDRQ